MGIADRDYQRNTSPRGGGFLSQITPMVKWLLIMNVGIFFLDLIIESQIGYKWMRDHGAFTIRSAIFGGEIWRFITFQFLHGGIIHLLMNSLGIYFFGPWMERWWGGTKFWIFYLLCGVGGALFFTLLASIGLLPGDDFQAALVGASAGIYGMLVGVAVIAPDLRVRLFLPPVELSMRQLAMGVLAISAVMVLLKIGGNEGGEAGHLGGALCGFLLMRYPHLLKSGGGKIDIFQPKVTRQQPQPKIRPRSEMEKVRDTEVDLILDKISSHGFQSLTQAEKDLLQKASTQKQSQR